MFDHQHNGEYGIRWLLNLFILFNKCHILYMDICIIWSNAYINLFLLEPKYQSLIVAVVGWLSSSNCYVNWNFVWKWIYLQTSEIILDKDLKNNAIK